MHSFKLGFAWLQEAAELYERGNMPEKAASIYIQTRAFALASPLMSLITHNPQLQLQFAKAKEGISCPVCFPVWYSA